MLGFWLLYVSYQICCKQISVLSTNNFSVLLQNFYNLFQQCVLVDGTYYAPVSLFLMHSIIQQLFV